MNNLYKDKGGTLFRNTHIIGNKLKWEICIQIKGGLYSDTHITGNKLKWVMCIQIKEGLYSETPILQGIS